MADDNLVRNGDFSEMESCWTTPESATNVEIAVERGRVFARCGPGAALHQDIDVTPGDYMMAFETRALYTGSGVTLRIQGLDDHGEPVRTLLQYPYGVTADWTIHAVKLAIPFTKVRLAFDVFATAEIDNVRLLAV
jgi:hypothetical protein